ncbi:MAG: hypothetical protein V4737_13330, partial [Curtobacterium sp.]
LFTSLRDFAYRVRTADGAELATKSSDLIALIEAGAFDEFGPRMGLSMIARTARTTAVPVPELEWGVLERASRQRHRLLTVVGEQPLQRFQQELRAWNVPGPLGPNGEELYAPGTPVGMLPDADGASVTTIGILAAFSTRPYRGGTMANLTIEGTNAQIRGVMWDEALQCAQEAGIIPPVGALIGATGRIQVRELETENDDGEEVTVRLREITVTALHPVQVHDPVSGALDGDVLVPDLAVTAAVPQPADAAPSVPAPAHDPEKTPSTDDALASTGQGELVTELPAPLPAVDASLEALFGAADALGGTSDPSPDTSAADYVDVYALFWDFEPLDAPRGESAPAGPAAAVATAPPCDVPTITVIAGWPGPTDADDHLVHAAVRLLAGLAVDGLSLQTSSTGTMRLVGADGAVLAHVDERL